MNVGIFIYDQAEVLDFSGPFEVFATANRFVSSDEAIHVYLIGETGSEVTARAGYKVTPHYGIENHPPIDVLVVVGGVHHQQMQNTHVLDWITQEAKTASIVASVCTGAFLLAQAGVITQQKVTTHWEDIDELRSLFPQLTVVENVRWVEDGSLVTSAGISAGIDMSLYLVSRTHGLALAEKTARQMDFDWTRNK